MASSEQQTTKEPTKLSLNLNAKEFIPKSNPHTQRVPYKPMGPPPMMAPYMPPPYYPHHHHPYVPHQHPPPYMKPPYTQQQPPQQQQHEQPLVASLNKTTLKNSKPFYPKSMLNKIKEEGNSKEQQVPSQVPKQKKQIVKDHYFLVDEQDESSTTSTPAQTRKKVKFDLEYMESFGDWDISKEKKLLTEDLLKHLEGFKTVEEEIQKQTSMPFKDKRKQGGKSKKYDNSTTQSAILPSSSSSNTKDNDDEFKRSSTVKDANPILSMEQWGRKDISKEVELAEQFKQKLEEIKQADPIKFEITELLNILTKDNYDDIKDKIFNIIQSNIEYQIKYLDVLFIKAVKEKFFVELYAKMCKDLDKILPQKINNETPNKKPTSAMRSNLVEKCRQIFKIENEEKFDSYVKVSDPSERDNIVKKFVLGNVTFISALINHQVLSKKIVLQCIENLFKRFESDAGESTLRLVHLEGIVEMMNNFGTLLKKKEGKIKEEELNMFNQKIDEYITKLEKVKEEPMLPGHVKYKIINLIERKKDNWVESKSQRALVAKSKEESRKEFLESQKPFIPIASHEDLPFNEVEISSKIRDDLIKWRDHLEEDNNKAEFDWSTVEEIYSKRKNTIADILLGYVESCIDFVDKPQNLPIATSYFKELIDYYAVKISKDEKFKVVDKTLELLKNVYDLALENKLVYDVMGNIVKELFVYDILRHNDFNRMKGLSQDQLYCIFTVFQKAIEENGSLKNQMLKIKFVKDNPGLFNKITQG